MALNAHVQTYGTTITFGGSAGPITAGIKSIPSLNAITSDEYEISRIDQEDRIKQFVASMIDPGELEVELAFDSGITGLAGVGSLTTSACVITFSNTHTLTFDGWIKQIAPEAKEGNEVTVKVKIRATDEPVYA